MRTTLDIDDSLMTELMARLPDRTKTEAIEKAIEDYVANDVIEQLRAMGGSLEIEDISQHLRRIDRRA